MGKFKIQLNYNATFTTEVDAKDEGEGFVGERFKGNNINTLGSKQKHDMLKQTI